jgi:glycosyltransferase involved in cell wall biosynthesis
MSRDHPTLRLPCGRRGRGDYRMLILHRLKGRSVTHQRDETERSAVRVCHVSTAHPADDSRVFWRECVGLARNGYEVTLVARADADGVREGVQIRALRTYRSRLVRMTAGVARAFRIAMRTRATIFHVHDPELLTMLGLMRLLGKKVVYDAHEVLSLQVIQKEYIPAPFRGVATFVARTVEKAAGRMASAVVTVSPAAAAVFPAGKVTLVANYPDGGLFETDEAQVESAAEPPADRPDPASASFIYVGGITIPRGIEQQIDAIELLNRTDQARLTLAGGFSPPELEQEVSHRPGWAYVDYLGQVGHDQVPDHLRRATAGLATLLPTRHHMSGPPVKSFEYIAVGLPMIISDFPEWRRVFEDADCALFVDPTDPAAIAAAMRGLIHEPGRAAELGANGRRAVRTRFSWQAQLDALLATYRRLSGAPTVVEA